MTNGRRCGNRRSVMDGLLRNLEESESADTLLDVMDRWIAKAMYEELSLMSKSVPRRVSPTEVMAELSATEVGGNPLFVPVWLSYERKGNSTDVRCSLSVFERGRGRPSAFTYVLAADKSPREVVRWIRGVFDKHYDGITLR